MNEMTNLQELRDTKKDLEAQIAFVNVKIKECLKRLEKELLGKPTRVPKKSSAKETPSAIIKIVRAHPKGIKMSEIIRKVIATWDNSNGLNAPSAGVVTNHVYALRDDGDLKAVDRGVYVINQGE